MPEGEKSVFANLVWQQRFNTVGEASYVSYVNAETVYAVCALGSVRILTKDVPVLLENLRSFCDSLERFLQETPPPSPMPARSRATIRQRRRP